MDFFGNPGNITRYINSTCSTSYHNYNLMTHPEQLATYPTCYTRLIKKANYIKISGLSNIHASYTLILSMKLSSRISSVAVTVVQFPKKHQYILRWTINWFPTSISSIKHVKHIIKIWNSFLLRSLNFNHKSKENLIATRWKYQRNITWYLPDFDRDQEHDNCGYEFASPAMHQFLILFFRTTILNANQCPIYFNNIINL